MARRPPSLLLAGLLLVAATACGPAEPRPPLRVASLLETPSTESQTLVEDLVVDTSPVRLEVAIPASRIALLQVRARGDAPLVRLGWRVEGERRFPPFRALTFPVRPDGEERVYEVDLRREPYWTGKIVELELAAESGAVELISIRGLGRRAGARVTSLSGLTVPSLPGADEVAVDLPPETPAEATFEAWIGLLPRFDRQNVTARFRARVETADGGEAVTWVDREIRGDGETGWERIRVPVEVPEGGRLVLEARAQRNGQPLPEGSAVWGAPTVLPRGHRGGGYNLLLVVIDTLRADVVGAYGSEVGATPHLDALARKSTRFEEMLAPAPWTLPSMVSLLTGQPPQVHGAGRRIGDFAPTALGDALPTLAGELARRGYYTAGFYNNIYLNPSFGLERGFDEWGWIEQDDEVIVDRVVERLPELADRRHLLLVHLFGPHHPYAPPEGACEVFGRRMDPGYSGPLECTAERRDVPTLDGVVPPQRDWRWIEGLYHGEVAHTDRQLGRLLAAVDELGLADETVVMVVSDHGEAFFDRLPQVERHGYEQADHGHTHFQELSHVPAVIHVPGRAPGVVSGPAELADLFPTALRLLGFNPPPTGGEDLAERMDGGPLQRRTLISDRLLYGPSRWSVRRGPWKLVVPRPEAAVEGEEPPPLEPELYDLIADPGETRDVSGSQPQVTADLRSLGEKELDDREALRGRLNPADEDVLSSAYMEWNHITKLRALGYLK